MLVWTEVAEMTSGQLDEYYLSILSLLQSQPKEYKAVLFV